MLRANKEAVMTVLDTLNFVAFNPLQNNNPIAVRRRKLMAKIDEQIQLATNKDYTPTQHKWVVVSEWVKCNEIQCIKYSHNSLLVS